MHALSLLHIRDSARLVILADYNHTLHIGRSISAQVIEHLETRLEIQTLQPIQVDSRSAPSAGFSFAIDRQQD